MKAKTKKNIGEVTACIVTIVGVLALINILFSLTETNKATSELTFDEYVNKETSFVPTPKERAIGNFFELLGCLTTLVISAIYGFALHRKRVRTAQSTYRVWWITLLIPLTIFLIAVMAPCNSFEGFLVIILVITLSFLPFGLVTFFYWIGLKGLKQMVKEEDEQKE
jgi:ABC-type Fe3+ transport system permease subunit